jgi:hypothetical protein
VDLETTDLPRTHPTLATRTSQLGERRPGRQRIECNTTTQAETGVIQISGITLWTDQTAAVDELNDSRSTVVAEFVVVLCDRATAATSTNRRIRRQRRRGYEGLATAAIEGTSRRHSGDVVLGMTI